MSDRLVHPGVPDELWLSVFVGVVAEDEAIARGRRAAVATSLEARRSILFRHINHEEERHDEHDPAQYQSQDP